LIVFRYPSAPLEPDQAAAKLSTRPVTLLLCVKQYCLPPHTCSSRRGILLDEPPLLVFRMLTSPTPAGYSIYCITWLCPSFRVADDLMPSASAPVLQVHGSGRPLQGQGALPGVMPALAARLGVRRNVAEEQARFASLYISFISCIYLERSLMELPNIAAHAYQDVHVWSALLTCLRPSTYVWP